MKTGELTGALLDYWTARAGSIIEPHIVDGECLFTHGESGPIVSFRAFAAQVAFRESGRLWRGSSSENNEHPAHCRAVDFVDGQPSGKPDSFVCGYASGESGNLEFVQYGESMMQATLRSFICSKFGDELPEIASA